MMRRTAVGLTLVLVLASACTDASSPEPPDSSAAPSPSASATSPVTPSASSTPTASPSVSPSAPLGVKRLVVPAAPTSFPATWREVFVVPYGPGRALLGTSPGGDSGSLDIGPEYGAPGPDGTWWFLDYAKGRLAHYDADGRYLDQVKIKKRLLVGGVYFQWSLPHVLADGTLAAVRQANDGAHLLRLRGRTLDEVPVDAELFSTTYDDQTRLYGFDQDNRLVKVDPEDGSVAPARVLRTPAGTRFSLTMDVDHGRLKVALPDAGVVRSLPLRTTSGALAHVGLQVRAGADDVLHLFLTGAGEDDESVQLVGYTSISATGTVPKVEGLPNPFNESDPGSPAQLVVAPGSSTPMLVYVLEDGVHVYERSG